MQRLRPVDGNVGANRILAADGSARLATLRCTASAKMHRTIHKHMDGRLQEQRNRRLGGRTFWVGALTAENAMVEAIVLSDWKVSEVQNISQPTGNDAECYRPLYAARMALQKQGRKNCARSLLPRKLDISRESFGIGQRFPHFPAMGHISGHCLQPAL